MRTFKPLTNIRIDCEKILSMWNANPSFRLADMDKGQFEALVRQIDQIDTRISDAEAQLIAERLQRQALYSQAADAVTRVRSMARGYFGPDTAQLKQTGHTIRSERRNRLRKAGLDTSASPASA